MADTRGPAAIRDVVFVSHATPEDNEFSLWLATQLARRGYKVWCDLTQLLGGEAFWMDIQEIIRQRCAKFVFVLSRTSNCKKGPLNELAIALGTASANQLHDFVVPLHVDDLPYSEIYVEINRLNAIAFEHGWAPGLAKLVEKLEKDGVPRSADSGPAAVRSWWHSHCPSDRSVAAEPQLHLSNWFPIADLNGDIYFHTLTSGQLDGGFPLYNLPYPAKPHREMLISLASTAGICAPSGPRLRIDHSESCRLESFIRDGFAGMDIQQANNTMKYLLGIGWEREVRERGLMRYQMANRSKCYYFRHGQLRNDRIVFSDIANRDRRRAVVGVKNRSNADGTRSQRYWHFGVETQPITEPWLAYRVRPHVVFSDDGMWAWDSKDRQHRARRQQCWDWWNDDWRDRLMAVMRWLADEGGSIPIRLGEATTAHVSCRPIGFQGQVRYDSAKATAIEYGDGTFVDEWDEESA